MENDSLENRIRKVVRVRTHRGRRNAVANAAGHPDGSWVSNWLAHRQKHVTIDEIAAMLKELGVSLSAVIAAPDAAALDWQMFGVMHRIKDDRVKQLAIELTEKLIEGASALDEQSPTDTATAHPGRTTRGSRRLA